MTENWKLEIIFALIAKGKTYTEAVEILKEKLGGKL